MRVPTGIGKMTTSTKASRNREMLYGQSREQVTGGKDGRIDSPMMRDTISSHKLSRREVVCIFFLVVQFYVQSAKAKVAL